MSCEALLRIYNYILHQYSVAVHNVRLQRVLHALQAHLSEIGALDCQPMLYKQANENPGEVYTCKSKELLRYTNLYDHYQVQQTLHLEKCWLRQCLGQRRHYNCSVKTILNVRCMVEMANYELLVNEIVVTHVIDKHLIITVQCH